MLLDPSKARALQATGQTFCLTVSAEEIVGRLRTDLRDHLRPLLAGDDLSVQVEQLLSKRAAGYGQFEQVPTDGREPDDIAADVIRRLGRWSMS